MGAFESVFGHDVKFDKDGKPIETGIGSLVHEAAQKAVEATAPVVVSAEQAAETHGKTLLERLRGEIAKLEGDGEEVVKEAETEVHDL